MHWGLGHKCEVAEVPIQIFPLPQRAGVTLGESLSLFGEKSWKEQHSQGGQEIKSICTGEAQ